MLFRLCAARFLILSFRYPFFVPEISATFISCIVQLSRVILLQSCNHCNLSCFLWSNSSERPSLNHGLICSVITNWMCIHRTVKISWFSFLVEPCTIFFWNMKLYKWTGLQFCSIFSFTVYVFMITAVRLDNSTDKSWK